MRVHRAVAFVDLCDFTAFVDRCRDEEVVLLLAELRSALRGVSARRGVRIVKWLGDGAMLASTSTTDLIALLVEIEHRTTGAIGSLALRAGVSEGPVIMFEGDDYIGRCVNVAARLCQVARPHEILGTLGVHVARPRWVTSEPTDPLVLRGINDIVEACRLGLRSGGIATDPICGLTIAPDAATRAFGNGTDHFCSSACADSWTQEAWFRARSGSARPARE